MNDIELPPPAMRGGPGALTRHDYFSAEQMRAYALEAARLEREACAELCDAMPDDAMVNMRVACAAAIRARGEA